MGLLLDNQISVTLMDSVMETFLLEGVIEDSSDVNSTFEMYVIPKDTTGGPVRPIYDLSRLTDYIHPLRFVLPTFTKALTLFTKNTFFAKIDIADAFLHLPVNQSVQKFLGLYYNGTTYRFTRVPFGLANGPWVCQRVYSQILTELKIEYLLYMDDILLYGSKL